MFGKREPSQGGIFDINILPMNLSEGRNIGDLSGLFVFTAPPKTGNNRQNEILFILFYVDNIQISNSRMKQWAVLLSDTYYASRGSFTMGMSTAVKKLSSFLEKDTQGQIMPTIFMNAAVLRERTLMIAHAGPVHSTIISSDKVQNFNNESCLPIQLKNNELSFFTADVHSEDIILLCPNVPTDWTNSAILEVTGDSPLNAIRFLLDRSGGNLQAAVIQLKRGKGQITIRSKTAITANIEVENTSNKPVSNIITRPLTEITSEEKPLFRKRSAAEIFYSESSETKDKSEETIQKDSEPESTEQIDSRSLTGEQQLPGAEDLPYDFSEPDSAEKRDDPIKRKPKSGSITRKQKSGSGRKTENKFNFKRFAIILLCGMLIPIIVVSVLFFIYSGRSKDQLHREYLSYAIAAAQKALIAETAKSQETLWKESLDYTDKALSYDFSPAANDLRKEAINKLDKINGGISTVYSYANTNKLPQGLNITEIASSGQYTYALDATSGSVMRFVASGNGVSLDSSFSCTPGTFTELGSEEKSNSVHVGALVDFTLLPSGNPHSFVLAGIDKDANVLYCSGFKGNQAGKLRKPETGRFEIKSVAFSNNSMYILDPQASAVWEFLFSSSDGFAYEPSNYYGSYSPYLSDVVDFTMYKEYSFFLRDNGTLLVCDYTGYRPVCNNITEVWSPDRKAYLNLENHDFRKIILNASPDNSIYIMDAKLQSVLNLSTKTNYIRYIVPNRTTEEISRYSDATGFGITGQNRLLWGYRNDLYIGNMP